MIKAKKSDRDVTRTVRAATFVQQLRRLADRIEAGDPFQITVGKERIKIPAHHELSIEHEREGTAEELEFQIRWTKR